MLPPLNEEGMPMLRLLVDVPNAITGLGLVLASSSLFLTLWGKLELGTALILWTWIADHLDGIQARRLAHVRSREMADFGKSFDGFVDIIHGVIFPAVFLSTVGAGRASSFVGVFLLLVLGTYRLSYFAAVGLVGGKFRGLPVSYNVPAVAALLICRPYVPDLYFPPMANAVFALIALLHISPLTVPPIRERAFPYVSLLAGLASFWFLVRAMNIG
ncbi:hypothetical protein C7U60_15290 [Mesorhizobium plurifarium]|nr:hypothetical protein C7U60_15290 [Mesorhizobium plurifarium]